MSLFFLVIPVPIIGSIVRYRASYYPKKKDPGSIKIVLPSTPAVETTSTTSAGERAPHVSVHVGPDVKVESEVAKWNREAASVLAILHAPTETLEPPPSFWGVVKKVWKTDQFEGIFKGIYPGLIFILLFSRGYVSPAPSTYFPNIYFVLPINFFYILVLVSTYRTIVSPHKIRLADPKGAYRLIFTEYERANALRFYQYSGLIPPYLIMICIDVFVLKPLYAKIGMVGPLLDHYDDEDRTKVFSHPVWSEWAKVGAYAVLCILATIVFTPFDVIITRLAIQPVLGKPSSEPAEERDLEKLSDPGLAPLSPLNLTTEHKPYLDFGDCFKRIVEEEGWRVLYRSWWLTFLGYWIPITR